MNHLETLTAEWLSFNGYFVRSSVRVGKRDMGGWEGELDVVGFHPAQNHFVHVECSTDGWTWGKREVEFQRKFAIGRQHAAELFSGMKLPTSLDKVIVHGYAVAPHKHRDLGGGRLITSQELAAEIMNGVHPNLWKSAVPENFPLLRTFQLSVMAGAKVEETEVRLVPIYAEPPR